MDINELEDALLGLMKGEHSSLSISLNDQNGPNYMTVKEAIEQSDMFDAGDWSSEEERQKAIATNRAWTVHWYPDTPVGFYAVHASTLAAAVEAALSQ